MIVTISCNTDRFNLSVVGEDFINDCCFGEDFSNWLVTALNSNGVEADVICMEDFGWANEATVDGITYLVCVAGLLDKAPIRPNQGEWRIMIERHRTLVQKLFGRNKMTKLDAIVEKIFQVISNESFTDIEIC